jgi:hypothetical protein
LNARKRENTNDQFGRKNNNKGAQNRTNNADDSDDDDLDENGNLAK